MFLCVGTTFGQKTGKELDSLIQCLKSTENDTARAKILRSIGTIYVDMGNYPKGIENFLQSKKLFEKAKNDYGVFRCDNQLGVTYCFMGDYKTALDYLLKCKQGIDDGRLYDNLGFVYYNQNNIQSSKIYWEKSLDFYKKESDNKTIARLLNKIGSCWEIQGKIDTAISYYKQSLNMSEGLNDKMNTINALASLGDVYFGQKNYSLALEYENKSLSLSKEIGDLQSTRETEKMLSDIYLKIGKCDTSLVHYKNYIAIKDSLVNGDNIKQVTRLEENFKFDKEREISVEKLQHQKNQRNIFITGFGIVLCLSVFLFRLFKRNQKAKMIITEQKKIVDEKKKEMTDNINYAERIQRAILPSDEFMNKYFPDNFIIYKPKDIVSGDFYWAYDDGVSKYVATADCTGHGVSGAMMSMIGTQLLNKIVVEQKITQPDLVLNALRGEIIKSLNREGASEERKDGMDISFCRIIKYDGFIHNGIKLECACANNSIYILRNGEVFEVKPDKMPIGKYVGEEKPFTLNELKVQEGDLIYTLSDGFCDQFGGEKGKKLMTKRLKEWIAELSPLNMVDTKNKLEERFKQWIGEGEQIDDVTIVAIKV